MSLSVQDIVNATSTDVRQVLGSSGADATLMVGWVDRIHKDCLHTSFYSFLGQATVSVITASGTGNYALGVTDIRRIIAVFDRTNNRSLLPFDHAFAPTPGQESVTLNQPELPKPTIVRSAMTVRPWPEYFRLVNATLYIFPAPQKSTGTGTLEVHYEKQTTTLSALGSTLVIPEDGKDMVVAGVNALALQFLKLDQDAMLWMQNYERMKRGEPVL